MPSLRSGIPASLRQFRVMTGRCGRFCRKRDSVVSGDPHPKDHRCVLEAFHSGSCVWIARCAANPHGSIVLFSSLDEGASQSDGPTGATP